MPWRAITSLGRYCVVSVTTATPIAAAPHYSPVRRVSGGAPRLSIARHADVVGAKRGDRGRERHEMEGAVEYMAIIFNHEAPYASAPPEGLRGGFATPGAVSEGAGQAGG